MALTATARRVVRLRALCDVALALLAAVNVAPRVGRFAGDALVHLAYAEQLARGHWFQFNPGEVSSGTTSVAWTLLDAMLLRVGGYALATHALTWLSLTVLLWTAGMIAVLARWLGATRPSVVRGALVFLSLPSVAYNAPLGMENTLFALASLLAVWRALTLSEDGARVGAWAALGACVGLAVWVRPEGVALAALPWVVAWDPDVPRPTRWSARAWHLVAAATVVAPLAWWHHRVTGLWLPGSGVARVMAARRDASAVHLAGPVWAYLAAPLRLVMYAPLVALSLRGLAPSRDERPVDVGMRRAVLALTAVALAGYTLVTGAAHAGRLLQWTFALLCVSVPRGIDRTRPGAWLLLAATLHVGVATAETALRWRDVSQGGGGWSRRAVMAQTERRARNTTRLLASLCEGGCCRAGERPAIATVEVQARIGLDARVMVRSLDGRTAPTRGDGAVRWSPDGCPDVDALIASPSVLGVVHAPLTQMPTCRRGATADALTRQWNVVGARVGPWSWSPAMRGWVRQCTPP